MSPARNVYVRDEALWQRAEAFAQAHGLSVSQVVAFALREYLNHREQNGGAPPSP
jgi:hypothetical protein